MNKSEILFDHFCFAQAAFESSRHVYRREHGPGQVRRLFNISFTAFELRRYMMNFYFSKGSFTISELVKVSDFSRPTVSSTVHEALTSEESDEHDENIIISEFVKGYTINNRVLRPSQVIISKKPSPAESEEKSKEESKEESEEHSDEKENSTD